MKYKLHIEIEFDEEWSFGAICGFMDTSKMCIDEDEAINFANKLIHHTEEEWVVPECNCVIKATVKEENGCYTDSEYIYGHHKKDKGFIKD